MLKLINLINMILILFSLYNISKTFKLLCLLIIILCDENLIKSEQYVKRKFTLMEVPTGSALIGRVVNALGQPLDNKGKIETETSRFIESKAPSIISRCSVNIPLETGLKVIDS